MAKNKGAKPPKSRPASTSALSQPLKSEHGAQITAFSHDTALFAQVTQAVDRARLRVYAADKAGVLADFLLPETTACHALAWVLLDPHTETEGLSSKKRKALAKAESQSESSASTPSEHVALGLSDGSILIYSPYTARVVYVLVASMQDSSASALTSMAFRDDYLWGMTANGWVHGWAMSKLGSASQVERVPPAKHFLPDSKSPMSHLACAEPGPSHCLITAHHALALYDVQPDRPSLLHTFTGHATPVQHTAWTGDHSFVSAAAEDRHLYCWFTHMSHAGAMITLDAPARRLLAWMETDTCVLLVVSERGTAQLYRMPHEAPKAKGLAVLTPCAHIQTSFDASELIDVTRTPGGVLRYARVVKGFKVVLDEAPLYDGDALKSVIAFTTSAATKPDVALSGTQRYKDVPGAAGTRVELPAHAAATASLLGTEGGLLPDESAADPHDEALQDGDMNEPTLAQRLKALKVQRGEAATSRGADGMDDEDDEDTAAPVGGASLASSLTQALHSGDHALLTSCLVHSDPVLIRTTVRRISGPLSVRLLEACVDRLNRGGVKSKGALGSARARGIVEWIHQTLTFHTAYLMSLPNLVSRLSQLHHSLAARLASHERLLALKGRMELVMNQIDMQMSYTADEANMSVQGQKLGKRSSASELDGRQQAVHEQQQGHTWVEPDDDEEQVEEIGLSGGDDITFDDEDAEQDVDEDVEDMDEDEVDEDSDASVDDDDEDEDSGMDDDDDASDDEEDEDDDALDE